MLLLKGYYLGQSGLLMNLERTESGKPWMNEILIIAQLRYPCVLPPRKIKEHRI